jgi:hypothetical protein
MTHTKATASEEHIAKVSEIKKALNAISLAMMGSPSVPATVLYPPGKVKAAAKVMVAMRIATREVLLVYVSVSDLISFLVLFVTFSWACLRRLSICVAA